ncbi:hypothetical protein [Sphingomonas jatrophae]|nr:hypothetical protein [Sphingomonas jatrophae]
MALPGLAGCHRSMKMRGFEAAVSMLIAVAAQVVAVGLVVTTY